MSAIANIVLPDAQATPVNHTFVPMSVKGDTASWANQAASLPIGFETIELTLQDPSGRDSVYRQSIKFRMPVLKTTTDSGGNSTTTVDYWLEFTGQVKLPSRCTLQNRKDFRKLVYGLFADGQFIDQVENLKHAY